MALELYDHPFSSYAWKGLIPFDETDTPFQLRILEEPENDAALTAIWPLGKRPMLVDDGVAMIESRIIVEHVAPRLALTDRDAAREVPMLDCVFDNHVMNVMQPVVLAAIKQSDVGAAPAIPHAWHWKAEDSVRHHEMGFGQCWGAAADQLVALGETG
ncbi:MAG: glutathione S-transferase N-terminal domain-containing protein [Sphingomonas sp.]